MPDQVDLGNFLQGLPQQADDPGDFLGDQARKDVKDPSSVPWNVAMRHARNAAAGFDDVNPDSASIRQAMPRAMDHAAAAQREIGQGSEWVPQAFPDMVANAVKERRYQKYYKGAMAYFRSQLPGKEGDDARAEWDAAPEDVKKHVLTSQTFTQSAFTMMPFAGAIAGPAKASDLRNAQRNVESDADPDLRAKWQAKEGVFQGPAQAPREKDFAYLAYEQARNDWQNKDEKWWHKLGRATSLGLTSTAEFLLPTAIVGKLAPLQKGIRTAAAAGEEAGLGSQALGALGRGFTRTAITPSSYTSPLSTAISDSGVSKRTAKVALAELANNILAEGMHVGTEQGLRGLGVEDPSVLAKSAFSVGKTVATSEAQKEAFRQIGLDEHGSNIHAGDPMGALTEIGTFIGLEAAHGLPQYLRQRRAAYQQEGLATKDVQDRLREDAEKWFKASKDINDQSGYDPKAPTPEPPPPPKKPPGAPPAPPPPAEAPPRVQQPPRPAETGPSLYDVLGVSRTATTEQITAAFRRKAMETHPDRGGDPAAFRAVKFAFDVLSNEQKKSSYDKYGTGLTKTFKEDLAGFQDFYKRKAAEAAAPPQAPAQPPQQPPQQAPTAPQQAPQAPTPAKPAPVPAAQKPSAVEKPPVKQPLDWMSDDDLKQTYELLMQEKAGKRARPALIAAMTKKMGRATIDALDASRPAAKPPEAAPAPAKDGIPAMPDAKSKDYFKKLVAWNDEVLAMGRKKSAEDGNPQQFIDEFGREAPMAAVYYLRGGRDPYRGTPHQVRVVHGEAKAGEEPQGSVYRVEDYKNPSNSVNKAITALEKRGTPTGQKWMWDGPNAAGNADVEKGVLFEYDRATFGDHNLKPQGTGTSAGSSAHPVPYDPALKRIIYKGTDPAEFQKLQEVVNETNRLRQEQNLPPIALHHATGSEWQSGKQTSQTPTSPVEARSPIQEAQQPPNQQIATQAQGQQAATMPPYAAGMADLASREPFQAKAQTPEQLKAYEKWRRRTLRKHAEYYASRLEAALNDPTPANMADAEASLATIARMAAQRGIPAHEMLAKDAPELAELIDKNHARIEELLANPHRIPLPKELEDDARKFISVGTKPSAVRSSINSGVQQADTSVRDAVSAAGTARPTEAAPAAQGPGQAAEGTPGAGGPPAAPAANAQAPGGQLDLFGKRVFQSSGAKQQAMPFGNPEIPYSSGMWQANAQELAAKMGQKVEKFTQPNIATIGGKKYSVDLIGEDWHLTPYREEWTFPARRQAAKEVLEEHKPTGVTPGFLHSMADEIFARNKDTETGLEQDLWDEMAGMLDKADPGKFWRSRAGRRGERAEELQWPGQDVAAASYANRRMKAKGELTAEDYEERDWEQEFREFMRAGRPAADKTREVYDVAYREAEYQLAQADLAAAQRAAQAGGITPDAAAKIVSSGSELGEAEGAPGEGVQEGEAGDAFEHAAAEAADFNFGANTEQAAEQLAQERLGSGPSTYDDIIRASQIVPAGGRFRVVITKPDGSKEYYNARTEEGAHDHILKRANKLSQEQSPSVYRTGQGGRPGQLTIPIKPEDVQREKEALLRYGRAAVDAHLKNAGHMLPATRRLSEVVANKLARMIAVPDYASRASEYYSELVLGPKSNPLLSKKAGAVLVEMRLQYMKQAYMKKFVEAVQEMNAARVRAINATTPAQKDAAIREYNHFKDMAQEAAEIHKNIGTMIGVGKSFLNAQEFQAAATDPDVVDVLQRYKQHMPPVWEEMYRRGASLDETEPINAFTQIPGMTMHLKGIQEGEEKTPGTVRAGGAGSYKKLRKQRYIFAKQAKGDADNYETDLVEIIRHGFERGEFTAAKNDAILAMVDEGVAKEGRSGQKDVELESGGKAREFPFKSEGYQSLYVDERMADDWDMAQGTKSTAGADSDVVKGFRKYVANPMASLSLAGVGELSSHSRSQIGIMMEAGMHPDLLVKNIIAKIRSTPEVKRRLMLLAREAELKPRGMDAKTFGYNPFKWGGQFLDVLSDVMRLTAQDGYARMVKMGIYPDSKAAERDFINQLGQYHKRGQSWMVQILRESGIGPFATATAQNRNNVIRRALLQPPVKPLTKWGRAYIMTEMLIKHIAAIGSALFLNWMLYKNMWGDEQTPLGALKLTNSAGNNISIDMGELSGLKRALREIGGLAILDYYRDRGNFGGSTHKEHSAGEARDRALGDVGRGLLSPFEGPPVQFAHTLATGQDMVGRHVAHRPKVSEGEDKGDQWWYNLGAAVRHLNPIAQKTFEGYDMQHPLPWELRVLSSFSPGGVKVTQPPADAGKPPTPAKAPKAKRATAGAEE